MFGPIELTAALRFQDYPQSSGDEVGKHRNFLCCFYGSCLQLAAGKNWQSFTCRYCRNFGVEFVAVNDCGMMH